CRGIRVRIFCLCEPALLRGDAAANWERRRASGVSVDRWHQAEHASAIGQGRLIIDGLFGTGLVRQISGEAAALIALINAAQRPVLALDLPSGLHADSGEIMGIAIKAQCTVTFAAPKKGFWLAQGPLHCGEVVVADIGFAIADIR
ncbi:MAG: NAD(P)H-hydrate epimerase, partial [Planctomycetota bacterium]|nr:NAD(P)H-hydrate epimerase [Planctomycetota bacterium]